MQQIFIRKINNDRLPPQNDYANALPSSFL
jgi:hypothetical protein